MIREKQCAFVNVLLGISISRKEKLPIICIKWFITSWAVIEFITSFVVAFLKKHFCTYLKTKKKMARQLKRDLTFLDQSNIISSKRSRKKAGFNNDFFFLLPKIHSNKIYYVYLFSRAFQKKFKLFLQHGRFAWMFYG